MSADQREEGVAGRPWVPFEIETIVAAYVDMLSKELRGERYTKAQTVRDISGMLPSRKPASIERKLQNISAILEELGWEWIDGYKPLSHYQRELKPVVLAAISPRHRIGEALAEYTSASLGAPSHRRLRTSDVLVPAPAADSRSNRRTTVALTGGPLAALRDYRARALGTAGEEWVADLERESLARAGRKDLADQIRWTAREDGDGAGFDISSFRTDGSMRLIEVKTTNLGLRTPFYVTRWEVDVSRDRADVYSLYRVHGFARDPKIYVLDGSIEENARLEPKVFLGSPR